MRSILKLLAVLALLLAVSAWYFRKQEQVNVAEGKGWDGVIYHQMYVHYKTGSSQPVYSAPFNKRIGLPWLAAQLPMEEARAFRLINIGSGLASCLLIYLTLIGRFPWAVVFACMVPAACYVFSPIRFPNFYPFTVDPPAFLLYALSAFFISRRAYFSAGAALAASVFFRESGVYLALALGMTVWLSDRKLRPAGVGICAMAAASLIAVITLQLPGGKYNQLYTVLSFFKHKMLDPLELVRAFACLCMTVAPFILCKARARPGLEPRNDFNTNLSQLFMMLCTAMALFGGSDTTRIFFTGYPLYVLLLARWASDADSRTLAFATVAGMVANSSLEMIPQPIAALPDRDSSGLFSLTPDYAHQGVVAISIAFWALWWFALVGPGRSKIDKLIDSISWLKAGWRR
jgi:hypothetical protein